MSKVFYDSGHGDKEFYDKTFYCPGCKCSHFVDYRWTITGSEDKPTVNPSILVNWNWIGVPIRCHLFIRDGQIQYLSDSTHEYSGKTIDMVPIEDEKIITRME